jgi:SNF2 family DNA or RNA helicase
MNVEAFSMKDDRARRLASEFLSDKSMLIVDESTTIKEVTADRTKFVVLKLAPLAAFRRILSGLPSPQSPLDLYSQLYFLDPSIVLPNPRMKFRQGFLEFRATYAVLVRMPFGPNKRMIDVVNGYKNIDQLAELIKPHSFRVRLRDCYDLPPSIYERLDVELTEEQKRIYTELKKFAVAHLSAQERVTATMVIVQLMRLQQVVSGHVKSDDGVISEIRSNRVAVLMEFLELTESKVVIWTRFAPDVERVSRALIEKYGPGSVARFWGENVDTREEEERAFKTDPSCRFMVATTMSGGRGRTWDVADVLVYFSNSESLEHRLQSEERASAVGRRQSVLVVDMVARGTVDEKILRTLRAKIDLSSAITGDDWREWII